MTKTAPLILLCLFAGCSAKHTIQVEQKNISVLKMEPMVVEKYKLEMPNCEAREGYIVIQNDEFDKIIKNNLRFKAIIGHNVNIANEKLSYYEEMIKNLGGVFVDNVTDIDIKKQ
ncbi:MAG: hypothetical protein IJT15_02120 [Rickettsiales bacterium]|nr:hypothetical protein [Rickettsiales bacterium]